MPRTQERAMPPTRWRGAPLAAVVLCLAVAILRAARPSAAAPAIRSRVPANPPGLPGDFNGDGEADLAVGVPGEDMGTVTDAGAVNVVYGSGGGRLPDGDQGWNRDPPGNPDQAQAGERLRAGGAGGGVHG